MDVQALINRCEDDHARTLTTYAAIWPGQPGGYSPSVAHELVQDHKRAGNFANSPNHKPAALRKKKPKARAA